MRLEFHKWRRVSLKDLFAQQSRGDGEREKLSLILQPTNRKLRVTGQQPSI